ncbi:HD domain-containing protein [Micromonospora sp. CPCC 206061]|uniref:HD domain-containing protein n=1 Tax=Micromonospora sp. CPCC 206061 TaxID=3122410 RepID=UPI002FF0A5D3
MSLVTWAYEISESELSVTLPTRWAHVQGVARKARSLAAAVGTDAELLEAAAILHDVGYAPDLAITGFHPLDGAYHLQKLGAPERIVHLIAHHSCAVKEAELRGLEDQLAAYHDEEGPVRDALWACDLTTTPTGEPTDFRSRIAEIQLRYGAGSIVSRFITSAEPELAAAVARTEERLRGL